MICNLEITTKTNLNSLPSSGAVEKNQNNKFFFVKLSFIFVIMEKPEKTPDRRPGQMALVAIKQQSKAVQVFKTPKVPVVKKNKVILSEDSYMKVCSLSRQTIKIH